ncbi:MAG: cell division protein FtsL [Halioglobus sp.]
MSNGANNNNSAAATTGRGLLALNMFVACLVLVSCFAIIHSTHACRALYAELQVLESSQWYLQENYGRLLLEQSTWASHHRVEKVARGDLGMREPDLASYRVVTP